MADIIEMLFNEYKYYPEEKLREITTANGYTADAESVAKSILAGNREEYHEFLKQQEAKRQELNDSSTETEDSNVIGSILRAIGYLVFVFGAVGTLIFAGGTGSRYEFSFGRFLLAGMGVLISGMMFLGFSELIFILHDIRKKMK